MAKGMDLVNVHVSPENRRILVLLREGWGEKSLDAVMTKVLMPYRAQTIMALGIRVGDIQVQEEPHAG